MTNLMFNKNEYICIIIDLCVSEKIRKNAIQICFSFHFLLNIDAMTEFRLNVFGRYPMLRQK